MLTIKRATLADTARYSCVARNLAGEKEKVTDIAVQGKVLMSVMCTIVFHINFKQILLNKI